RKAALPILGSFRAVHVLEEGLGVAPGNRQANNFWNRDGLLDGDALRSGNGGPAGRLRISRDHEIVGDGAVLDVAFGSPGAVGKHFAFSVAIFGRVRVNQQGADAETLRGEGLEAAIAVGIRVADEDDFAAHVDAVFTEHLVVLGVAAVGVDDRGGELAGSGESHVGGGDGGILRVGVGVVGVFAEAGAIGDGRDHLQLGGLGAGVPDVISAEHDLVPTLLVPFGGDEAGEFVVARRT